MKRLLFVCMLTLTACGPYGTNTAAAPSQTSVAPRIELLKTDTSGAHCTADGAWCATGDADAGNFAVSYRHHQVATLRFTDGGHDLWDQIVRTPRADGGEDVLVGVSHTDERAYSGGGGQAVQVSLYPLSSASPAPATPAAVVSLPTSAAIDIRACFSEADQRARRDACSDQYNFTGTLTLDTAATPAKLVLTTEATSYPAGISRNADNTRPLTAGDLRTVRDQTCSYRRVFVWDAASKTYKPDAPLPPCSDYLEP